MHLDLSDMDLRGSLCVSGGKSSERASDSHFIILSCAAAEAAHAQIFAVFVPDKGDKSCTRGYN